MNYVLDPPFNNTSESMADPSENEVQGRDDEADPDHNAQWGFYALPSHAHHTLYHAF